MAAALMTASLRSEHSRTMAQARSSASTAPRRHAATMRIARERCDAPYVAASQNAYDTQGPSQRLRLQLRLQLRLTLRLTLRPLWAARD
jgi:hypothetical protein